MQKLISRSLILILSFGFLAECKKDKGDPPALPPQESMSIDFSNFDILSKANFAVSGLKGTENSNWDFASGVAVKWKLIINTTLIVPVTSFKLASGEVPVYISDKTWQWSYNVTIAGAAYKARLTGLTGAGNVTWKMYITKDGTGGFTEFLWFEGTSGLDGNGGQWILYQSPQSPVPILQIDWTKSGASIGIIKYTFVKNADPFKDSYIEYGLTKGSLNAYYTIHYYNSSILKFSDVNVEWNTTTHNGRVKCIDYLGDTNWHCWDANKINMTCI